MKKDKGYKSDTDLTAEDLKDLCSPFKAKIKEVLEKEFPDEPYAAVVGRRSARYLHHGTANARSLIAVSKVSLMSGELRLTSRLWFSGIWAMIPRPVLPLAVTPERRELFLR